MAKENKISFTTTILQVGNNTGICVPDEIVEKLGSGKKPPVKVTVNNYTYQNTIATMGGKFMISVSADIRNKASVKGGDKVTVYLELDTEPRVVSLPPDFKKALEKNVTARKFFETLSNSNKKKYTLPIADAKTDETRNRRIEKAVSDLSEGKK
ncbi:MAG: YdeI/OmpD-associated family protein [Ferruginibacter sp.]